METDMSLKMKLVEMHADVETGQSRWVMAIIVVALLFIMTLVIYTLPVMEYVTQTERTAVVAVTGQTGHDITVLEVAGLPYTFTVTFSAEFDTERSTKNDWAYIYIFKDVNPGDYFASDMPGDDEESLNRFLKTLEDSSIRHKKLTFTDTDVEWTLAWRDCDTTTFYIVIYNPIQYPPVGGGELSEHRYCRMGQGQLRSSDAPDPAFVPVPGRDNARGHPPHLLPAAEEEGAQDTDVHRYREPLERGQEEAGHTDHP